MQPFWVYMAERFNLYTYSLNNTAGLMLQHPWFYFPRKHRYFRCLYNNDDFTVEPQWLEHLRDHGNLFMGSSSHCGLIMAQLQEGNNDNFGKSFWFSTQRLNVEYTHLNRLDEAILMSILNIQFHDKIRKKILNIRFLELLEEFCRDWKKSSNHLR